MDEEVNMLSNNEGVLAKEIASDGDKIVVIKFFSRQLETIGSNACDKASLVSGIGNFVKYVSNGFCAFKDKNSEYLGVILLDPNLIRAISSDVSRHLKS